MTEIEIENRKIRCLRILVDMTAAILSQTDISAPEAITLIANTKKAALAIFPDKEETFNLIYKPRFERLIKDRLEFN